MRISGRLVATTAAAGVAGALALALTRHGVLLNPDSPTYLWTARLIRSDVGRLVDLPADTTLSIRGSFPPVYPTVLAAIGAFGHDVGAGRLLGVVLAAAVAAMLVRLVARNSSVTVAVIVGLVVFASRAYAVVLFGFLMSDGLFVALALLALSLLEPTLHDDCDPRRARVLAIASFVVAGLGLGTRFVGIGLVVAVPLIVLLLSRGIRRRRIAAGVGFLAAVAPMAAWQAADSGAVGLGGFRLGWYPPLFGFLRAGDSLVWSFVPRPVLDRVGPVGVRVIGIALLVLAVWWSITVGRRALAAPAAPSDRLAAAFLVVGWMHLGALVASRLFVDPFIEAEGRQTMLWLTCLLAAAGLEVHRRVAANDAPDRAKPIAIAAVVVLLLGAGGPLVRSVERPEQAWWNLAHERRSQLARRVAAIPGNPVVYSNREDIIYLQAHRRSKALSLRRLRDSTVPDPMFESRTRAMGAEVRTGDAVVVVFTADPYWAVPVDVLERLAGLRVSYRNAEGVILTSRAG